jgi:hypothetical protein
VPPVTDDDGEGAEEGLATAVPSTTRLTLCHPMVFGLVSGTTQELRCVICDCDLAVDEIRVAQQSAAVFVQCA